MPRVIVTCPDRRGIYNGVWAIGKHFPDGKTEIDLTDAELANLEGEISRRETIVTVHRVGSEPPPPAAPPAAPQPSAQQKQQQQVKR